MKRIKLWLVPLLIICFISVSPGFSSAWFDETHLAIAKAAGYKKWFNATGADMAKLKAGKRESHNHYANNPPGTLITSETVIGHLTLVDRLNTSIWPRICQFDLCSSSI
jgi:hypothetical protein